MEESSRSATVAIERPTTRRVTRRTSGSIVAVCLLALAASCADGDPGEADVVSPVFVGRWEAGARICGLPWERLTIASDGRVRCERQDVPDVLGRAEMLHDVLWLTVHGEERLFMRWDRAGHEFLAEAGSLLPPRPRPDKIPFEHSEARSR